MYLIKRMFLRKIKKMKTLSYWIAKIVKISILFFFKNKLLILLYFILNNINKFVNVFLVTGFVISMILVIIIFMDIIIKKESLENILDKINFIVKKVLHFLIQKIVSF